MELRHSVAILFCCYWAVFGAEPGELEGPAVSFGGEPRESDEQMLSAALKAEAEKKEPLPHSYRVDPPEEVKVKSIAEAEFKALKHSAMPLPVAEARFHEHFPPWSQHPAAKCPACYAKEKSEAAAKAEADAAAANKSAAPWRRLGDASASAPARLTRFVRAVGSASVPKPAVGACLNLQMDLASLGIPGVIMTLGIEGELQYDICTRCFAWNFNALLGFNVVVSVLGYNAYFSLTLTGNMNLKELTCNYAKNSNFCKYLHVVLPEYVNRMLNRDSMCHSDSPFEIITAYIKFQYAALQTWINEKYYSDENTKYASSPLALSVKKLEDDLKKYPAIFRSSPAAPPALPPVPPAPPSPPPSFMRGSYNSMSCPAGSINVNSIDECKAAAKALGYEWGGTTRHSDAPKGCYEYDCGWWCDDLNFNTHSTGGIHWWTRPMCMKLPTNDGFNVQLPTKVQVECPACKTTYTAYIWMVTLERRLCWSRYWPEVIQGDDRGYDDLVALHSSCSHSLTVNNLPQRLEEITLSGQRVTVPTQRDLGSPLTLKFASDAAARGWRQNLLRFVAGARQGGRRILISKCMRAQLNTRYEPFCVLEVPGQTWASTYQRRSTSRPSWGKNGEGEGVGLRVDASDFQQGGATIRVAVHDMSASVAERAYSFWMGWSTVDPLFQYIGQARASVCTKPRQAKWQVISSSNGCEGSDRVEVEGWRYFGSSSGYGGYGYSAAAGGLAECKRLCEEVLGCSAVDYSSTTGLCNVFNTACTNPSKSRRSSHKLVQLGCDAVQSTPGVKVEIQKQLWVREDHTRSWNPFYWFLGAEYKPAGKVWLTFEWAPEAPNFYSAWHPKNDAIYASSMPGLSDASQAMFAAVDSLIAKFPEYSRQVARRLQPFDKDYPQYEDRWLTYGDHTGRFMARWHPRAAQEAAKQEGLSTTPPPSDAVLYSCPPPSDAGCYHKVYCEYEHQKTNKNSWSQYLVEEWLNELRDQPCSGAELSNESIDDRVVHFHRAMKESKYSKNVNTTVEFHAEVATSVLNLFVRVLQDVQGLWASYFADDPAWNGDCHSVTPYFVLPYEFGPDMTQGREHAWQVRTHDSKPWYFINHRASGLVNQRHGYKMPTESNPFCRWKWASGRVEQEKRADFLKQDAPINGRDGYATPPNELSAKMFPQLWCIAVQNTNGSSLTGPLKGTLFENGTTVRYLSSCQQLRRITVDGGRASKSWRRYDCEEIDLTRAFVTFFPNFVKQAIGEGPPRGGTIVDTGMYGQLGTIVEDVLQCAGRIAPAMRQFPHRSYIIDIDELCDGTEGHLDMLDAADPDDQDFQDIVTFVKASTQEAISVLKKFVESLQSRSTADSMTADFKRLFAYYDALDGNGTLLTGEAWKAGLSTAMDLLGTEAAALARIEAGKAAAVQAQWDALDPSERRVTALFPLPVQYRALADMSVGISSNLANLCEKRLPTSMEFSYRVATEGQTWRKPETNTFKVCMRGGFTPFPAVQLAINVEGCWGTQPHLAEGTLENTWRMEVRALVRDRYVSMFGHDPRSNSLSEKMLTHHRGSKHLGWSSVNDVNSNIGWQLARRILLDPFLLLRAVRGMRYLFSGDAKTLSLAAGAMRAVADSIQHNILFIATDVMKYAVYKSVGLARRAKEIPGGAPSVPSSPSKGGTSLGGTHNGVPFYADLDVKSMEILDVHVELQRIEGPDVSGPWTKAFDVHWTSRSSLGGHIAVPNFMATETRISLSSHYDLSEVFNVIFEEHSLPISYYGCCMLCLQSVGPFFCMGGTADPKAPACLTNGSTACASGTPIHNITNCSDPSVGYATLEKKYRVAGLCQATTDEKNWPKKTDNVMQTQGILGATILGASEGPGQLVQPTLAPTTTITTTTLEVNIVLSGTMNMNVPDVAAFEKDVIALNAVADGIAEIAQVQPSYISLNVVALGSRRLDSPRLGDRRLVSAVELQFSITVPPGAAVAPTTASNNIESKTVSEISAAVQEKVVESKGADYTVTVTAKSAVTDTAVIVTTTTTTTNLNMTSTTTSTTTTAEVSLTYPKPSGPPPTTSGAATVATTGDGHRNLSDQDLVGAIFTEDGNRCVPTIALMTGALMAQCAIHHVF